MMSAGIQLTVLGMSAVFVFLTVLVLLMGVSTAVVRRLTLADAASGAGDTVDSGGRSDDMRRRTRRARLTAAALAAVAQHHSRRLAPPVGEGTLR